MFRSRLSLALLVLALVALFFPTFTTLLTDWWWFREIGYQVVFTREVTTRLLHRDLQARPRGEFVGDADLSNRREIDHIQRVLLRSNRALNQQP